MILNLENLGEVHLSCSNHGVNISWFIRHPWSSDLLKNSFFRKRTINTKCQKYHFIPMFETPEMFLWCHDKNGHNFPLFLIDSSIYSALENLNVRHSYQAFNKISLTNSKEKESILGDEWGNRSLVEKRERKNFLLTRSRSTGRRRPPSDFFSCVNKRRWIRADGLGRRSRLSRRIPMKSERRKEVKPLLPSFQFCLCFH